MCGPLTLLCWSPLPPQDDFEENPGRKWLSGFLRNEEARDEAGVPRGGGFVDIFRSFHPTRTGAFTCWSTLTGARHTNYGTRIDYIFADCQLAREQFVAADVLPEVGGSDHCPVWAELRCSPLPASKPPPLSTCYLPEFAGKQQKLSRFLVKVDPRPPGSEVREELPGSQEEEERRENINVHQTGTVAGPKRLRTAGTAALPKGKKTKTSQGSRGPQGLLAFFKPKITTVSADKDDTAPVPPHLHPPADDHPHTTRTRAMSPSVGASFWKSVLSGPPPPPSCKVHGEPCVLRTVKKEGPNVGRQFFVCARPQGHASNPQARCHFFLWVDRGK